MLEIIRRRRDAAPCAVRFSTGKHFFLQFIIGVSSVPQVNPVARTRLLAVDTAHPDVFFLSGNFGPVRSVIDDLDIRDFRDRAVCRLVLAVTVEHTDAHGAVDVV